MKIKPFKVVEKKWGKEIWFQLTSDYCFKEIIIYQGHCTSLQYHVQKEETNLIVSGEGLVTLYVNGDLETQEVKAGDLYHFKPGEIHRFEATSSSLVMHETSTKHIDDVIRIEDSYGREGTSNP